ncbi:hypothetical protein GGX14DRAFT_415376 [Mycena pura]|uniref:Uncharacterized protein n=1 Tax=Mycena pura TaxID=153505 RepID=A0AAD6YTH7_9AGAR|nr:hypothetical protein GGX14DRAFT_415376 [Mycena pura]
MSTLPLLRLGGFRHVYRLLQGPPRHSSGVPATTESPNAISVPLPIDRVRQRNFDLLLETLSSNGNPSRVWANYTNLITFLGYERLPLEIHQQVLRKCTPSSRLLRASAARRLFAGNVPRIPHVYEGRFQAVIRNIRASGAQPTLDDYSFILEQFAAVGHHFGAIHVYRELTSLGIVPRTKTFGLCLQAVAHRLTLPVHPRDKVQRIAVTRRMVSDLVSAMKSFNIPFTSVNLDLTMRILKETTDMQGFELLMKWGYGIDLANPDCPPLEYLQSTDADAVKPTFQQFSTAALNMTIDTLGRLKNISRMVQAFEVLTTPLSTRHSSVSYDEDEDEDYGGPRETIGFTRPSASPNTTTYNILIRHISQAGHAVFARHYLLQAMELERQVMLRLKRDIGRLPLEEVPSPHFAINRGTLLSVFGESNRDKNVGLMRWLHSKFYRILSMKRGALRFFMHYRMARVRKRLWPYEDPSTFNATGFELPSRVTNGAAQKEPLLPTKFTTIAERWKAPNDVGAVFDVDVDDESAPPPTPTKSFDLDLHIGVLKRDVAEIEALYAHVETILARTTQRMKERLERRVWRGKDIYLRTEGDMRQRVRVSAEKWKQIAGFRKGRRQKKGSQRPGMVEHGDQQKTR